MFAPYLSRIKNYNWSNPFTVTLPRIARVLHSMTHWADNYTTAGHILIISIPPWWRPGWRQRQVTEDQQPGLVRWQPPQEQHGGGGCYGAGSANYCSKIVNFLFFFRPCLNKLWYVYVSFLVVNFFCHEWTIEQIDWLICILTSLSHQ